MLFVLVKALSALLYPIFSAILVVAAGLSLRRFRRRTGYGLAVGGLAYLYLCSTYQFSSWLADRVESNFRYVDISDVPEADAIVVLGGGVSRSGGLLELADSADRVLHGSRLLKSGKSQWIIFSAGNGYGQAPGSEAMSEFSRDLGIPADKIVEETRAQNTYEHTVYLKPIFEERGIRSIVLVTSAWHMRRSLAAFESQMGELQISVYPVDSLRGRTGTIVDFLPTSRALDRSTVIIKEYVGYIIYDIAGWIK